MTGLQTTPTSGPPRPPGEGAGSRSDLVTSLLKQALEEMAGEPPMAIADWIAQVVDPQRPSTIVLVCDPATSLTALTRAKDLYKLLRVMGRTKALRRVGRRMYAAAIAAALVHHETRISHQSDRALGRAFHYLSVDEEVPAPIREIVQAASRRLPAVIEVDEPEPDESAELDAVLPAEAMGPFAQVVPETDLRLGQPPPDAKGKNAEEAAPKKVRGINRRRAKHEARRLHGEFDPLLGTSFQRRQAYCQACRSMVEVRRKLPPRTLHGWITLLTLGLWLPVWGVLELAAHLRSWRCVNCRRRIYQALIS